MHLNQVAEADRLHRSLVTSDGGLSSFADEQSYVVRGKSRKRGQLSVLRYALKQVQPDLEFLQYGSYRPMVNGE
ncbi:hypothetical protein D9M71_670290 [compost metagenome]